MGMIIGDILFDDRNLGYRDRVVLLERQNTFSKQAGSEWDLFSCQRLKYMGALGIVYSPMFLDPDSRTLKLFYKAYQK
jgi:hypothetical protein